MAPKAGDFNLSLGDNVSARMEGDSLHIMVDLSKELYITTPKPDQNGKMRGGGNKMVATTHGNTVVPGTDLKLSINAYRPHKA